MDFDVSFHRLPQGFGFIRTRKVERKIVSTDQARYVGARRIEVLHHAHVAHILAHHRGDATVARLALAPDLCVIAYVGRWVRNGTITWSDYYFAAHYTRRKNNKKLTK